MNIRLTDVEVLEEDAVQALVVVLSRVDHGVFTELVQAGNDAAQTNDLWPGAKNR